MTNASRTLLTNLRNYGALSILRTDPTMRTARALESRGLVEITEEPRGRHYSVKLTVEGRKVGGCS